MFNLVPDADGSWPGMAEVLRLFPCVLEVGYAEYLNRTLVAGTRLPAAGCVGRWLQADLRRMGSQLEGRTRVGTPLGTATVR